MSESPPRAPESTLSLPAIAGGIAVLILGLILATFAIGGNTAVPEQEIARRCAESVPRWDNYQEDIKGQIGAQPVAEWKGDPLSVETVPEAIRIQFLLEGAWVNREVAIPLLVKLPNGEIRVVHGRGTDGDIAAYALPLDRNTEGTQPWIEVQYPHHRLRIGLNAEGNWDAESNSP